MIKSISLLLLSVFLFSQNCFALNVSARSAILYEPVTGTVLYEKDSKTQREIASTTKIMTAVVVLENAELSDVVTVPKECVGVEGTSMYLKENEKVSVFDLLYGLMMQSGNDAAMALAYHTGDGDISRFVAMMNETANRIGMKNSSFKNPNGLPADGHVSTAYDMALLAAYAMKIPEFAEIVATKEKSAAGRYFTNHNKLLRMYSGANGVKTGFTKAAGRCLVSSAERDGMSLVAVTLSAPDDWDDHTRMLDYGFENYAVYSSPLAGETVAELPVVGGEEQSVSAVIAGDTVFLEKRSEKDKIKQEIYLPRFQYAPITCGDVVGEVRYVLNGKLLATSEIVSNDSVAVYNKPNFFEKIFDLFRGA